MSLSVHFKSDKKVLEIYSTIRAEGLNEFDPVAYCPNSTSEAPAKHLLATATKSSN